MRDLPPNMTDYLATRASFRLEVPERYNYARAAASASPISLAPRTGRPGSWPARGWPRVTGCS
jgi:hypothetical protein